MFTLTKTVPPPSPPPSPPHPNQDPHHETAGANKPARCENVPTTACAVAYDSSTCNGGWRLVIPQVSENTDDDLNLDGFDVDFQGEMRFRWFTATYSYRFHPLDSWSRADQFQELH